MLAVGHQRQDRRGLGQAVALDQLDAVEGPERPLNPFRRHRRAAVEKGAQAGEVVVRQILLLEGQDDHGRRQHGPGDAPVLDRAQQVGRGEGRQEGVAAAHQGEAGAQQVGGMEHRRNVQIDVVGKDADRVADLHAVRDGVAVAERHALRAAGRAAGVEQDGGVVLLRLVQAGRLRRGDQGLVIVLRQRGAGLHGIVRTDHADRAVAPAGQRLVLQQAEKRRIDRDDLRPGIVEDVGDLRRRQAYVDRRRHRAHPVAGVQQLEIAEGVARERREGVAAPDAQRLQAAGEPRHPAQMLRPGPPPFAVDRRGPAGIIAPAAVQRR